MTVVVHKGSPTWGKRPTASVKQSGKLSTWWRWRDVFSQRLIKRLMCRRNTNQTKQNSLWSESGWSGKGEEQVLYTQWVTGPL